jgi:T-complex protein 1 subunit eta
VKSGANIVLSRLAIGDLATQYFADHGIFCAGRVPDEVRTHNRTFTLFQAITNLFTVHCRTYDVFQKLLVHKLSQH